MYYNSYKNTIAFLFFLCFMLTTLASNDATLKPILSVATLSQHSKPTDAIVVIDPGHGGKDPGATGPKGIHEKNVVLHISKDLKKDIDQYANLKADVTRHGDYFVTLRGRLGLARKDHANLFLAIHADAYNNPVSHGASVFALSERGATSEAARWVARSENYAYLGGAQFHDQSKQVQSVLLDLSQTATINDSVVLGRGIYNELAKFTHMHSHKVEQARFVVLKSPDIPSLLIETGFISNRDEERRLNSAAYQQKMANAMAHGIVQYLYVHPPAHSLIALQQSGLLQIKVKAGQTLLGLARSYHTSMARFRKVNHLKHDSLDVGQQLLVPAVGARA